MAPFQLTMAKWTVFFAPPYISPSCTVLQVPPRRPLVAGPQPTEL